MLLFEFDDSSVRKEIAGTFSYARNAASYHLGGYSSKKMREVLESGVKPSLRNVTLALKKEEANVPLYSLGKFSRFGVYRDRISIHFLTPALDKIAKLMQAERVVQVSEKMRKFFAHKGAPLRKETKVLSYPARNFAQLVAKEIDSKGASVFSERFCKKIEERWNEHR